MSTRSPYLVLWGHRGEDGSYPWALSFASVTDACVFMDGCGAAAELRELDPRTGRYGAPVLARGPVS